MEPIVSSETSAIRTQTPGNYPKRNKLHLEHGESLKTRINKEFYVEVLRHLREWQDGDWMLHQDNAPAHTLHLVQQFLAKHGTAQLQQPP